MSKWSKVESTVDIDFTRLGLPLTPEILDRVIDAAAELKEILLQEEQIKKYVIVANQVLSLDDFR